jgi:hypothetical protein
MGHFREPARTIRYDPALTESSSPTEGTAAPGALPIRQGLAAARANVRPATALWAVAMAVVVSYYTLPSVQAVLQQLAQFKLQTGLIFGAISTALFGGLIPVVIQKLRPALAHQVSLQHLPFFALFWASKGVEVDLLYMGQALVFGDTATPRVIIPKVMVDQFGYAALWAVPSIVLAYAWKDAGFSWRALRQRLESGWYKRRVVPVLLSNWAVWIPAVAIVYCLPLPLQLPLQNLVLCLWALILIFMTQPADKGGPPA